jgi:hypothetical protein
MHSAIEFLGCVTLPSLDMVFLLLNPAPPPKIVGRAMSLRGVCKEAWSSQEASVPRTSLRSSTQRVTGRNIVDFVCSIRVVARDMLVVRHSSEGIGLEVGKSFFAVVALQVQP